MEGNCKTVTKADGSGICEVCCSGSDKAEEAMRLLHNNTVKLSKHNFFLGFIFVFLTIPWLNPGYLNNFVFTKELMSYWRYVSFALLMIWMLVRKKRVSSIIVLIGIQQMYLLLITLFHSDANGIRTCRGSVFLVLGVVLLYELAHENKRIFLSSQLFCFEVVIYINLITEILFPDGMYIKEVGKFIATKNWFLGYYNNHTQYFLPALLFAFLYKNETGRKLRTYMLTIAIFISAILGWSGGILVALFGMAAVYVFFKNRTEVFHYYTYWGLHILFVIFVILLKCQRLLFWLIDGVLDKWGSLELRMSLWDRCLQMISEAFLFGHGIETGDVRAAKAGFFWGMHAHNQLLELMYQGGIINLLLFAVVVIVAGRKVYRYRNTMESKIISIAFLGWCLCTLVEPYATSFLIGMFVVAYYNNINKSIEMGFT